MASYFSPKIEVRECRIGKGLFATAPISRGDVVIDFTNGPGTYLNSLEAWQREHDGCPYIIQVDDNRFLSNLNGPEKGDFINHSCDPNCGLNGSVMFVAMRDIAAGEEIVFDYAMTESRYAYRMACDCRTALCRGAVTGNDWKNKTLQQRYGDHFSKYILKKIRRHPAKQWALETTNRFLSALFPYKPQRMPL